jgi:hypothetical protein
MNEYINDLVYKKYEQFSLRYVVSIEQITDFIKSIIGECPEISDQDLNNQLDDMIDRDCYLNLPTSAITDFNTKLKHNIEIAQVKNDKPILDYLRRKFNIDDDLSKIDLLNWDYKPNKIKIKLKLANHCGYTMKTLLSDFFEIPKDKTYKYKSDIIKFVHKYIYENQLQSQTNKSAINPDENLANLLLPLSDEHDSYTYFNLQYYIRHMICDPTT